jgi:PAS domain S-box-containing protein
MTQDEVPPENRAAAPLDRALFELSPDAVYIHQDEKVVFANPAMLRLLGAERESELMGRSIWDIIHPDSHGPVRKRIERLRGNPELTAPLLEQQFVTLRGSVVDVEATACSISFAKRSAFLVVVRDISERRRAQEEIRKSEAKYRSMFENAIEGIFQSSPEGRYLEVNPAYAAMFGYDSPQQMIEEVTDIAKQIYFDPGDRVRFIEMMSECTDVHGFEVKLRQRDGSPIWISENLRCECDDSGAILYYEGIVEDITARNAAQDALRQAEERFSKAFHASPDGITISTFENGRYVDVNSEYVKLIGYQRAELIGKTSTELNLWIDSNTRDGLVDAVREHGFVKNFPAQMRTKAGKVRNVEISADRIHVDDVEYLLAISRDVTDTKLMEQQFRQAEKLQAIGQLAGGIAHDFNNALMVIDTYTDLASNASHEGFMQASYLEEIRRASKRAAQLTSQLLAFSRKQPIVRENVDVSSFIAGSSEAWQRMLGEKISLRVTLAPQPGHCSISVAQLEHALLNILLNARDAMPLGGTVFLQSGLVVTEDPMALVSGPLPPGRYARIDIRDTGEGIAPELIEHLFEPFFTTKPKGVGTGLGLASVYGIVAQSDGFIDVASEFGAGATFSLYFPATDRPSPAEEIFKEAPNSTEVAARKILLVEDNEALLDALSDWLRAKGFQVVAAPNGEAALKKGEHQSFDILISDVVMPGMDGNELYRIYKSKHPSVRTILMSGYQDAAVNLDSGVLYLTKPFSFAQLSEALNRLNSAAN